MGVYASIAIPDRLRKLAARQGGVFSVSQAAAHGVTRQATRRLRRDGHWHGIAPGVLATSDAPEWLGWAWAGVLQATGGVLGGAAAAHLWGLCPQPTTIDVWSTSQVRRGSGPWRFRRGERLGTGCPPRLKIERAALELCGMVPEAEAVRILAGAVGTRRTTAERLRLQAEQLPTLGNRRLVLEVLGDVVVGVESPLERRYFHDVERAHRLPPSMRQFSASIGTRSDVAYPDHGLLIELDGRVWHQGLAAWADAQRDNQHVVAGFRTLRFTWHAIVDDPCRVAALVAGALRTRGWEGSLRNCPRCRRRV